MGVEQGRVAGLLPIASARKELVQSLLFRRRGGSGRQRGGGGRLVRAVQDMSVRPCPIVPLSLMPCMPWCVGKLGTDAVQWPSFYKQQQLEQQEQQPTCIPRGAAGSGGALGVSKRRCFVGDAYSLYVRRSDM